ncbi:hypothetical protein [Acidihalobacter prosperus]|uniref:Uncharacterized protein n=1 Tax=Acidihalobacter prosperus TaxID=160660 RepID=A0A1A6C298_9GAMM|nr:hypothetical protein [Acidihalobacter prosperus]OBS08675.1 hypothetical protein Thpro_022925 [Acidihalobacter prosperus]
MHNHPVRITRSIPALTALMGAMALSMALPAAHASMPPPASAVGSVASRALLGEPQNPNGRFLWQHAQGMQPTTATMVAVNGLSARSLLGDPQTPEGRYAGQHALTGMGQTSTIAMAPSALGTKALMGDPEAPWARFG